MKTFGFSSAVWIVLASTSICLVPIKGWECIPNNTGPCRCGFDSSIDCYGWVSSPLTQTVINDFFLNLRLHNHLATNETLELASFSLDRSNLSTFDLTPLLWTKMEYFTIFDNNLLTRIVGPGAGNEPGSGDGSIDAVNIRFTFNLALTDEGLGDTLKLFNGSRLYELDLEYNLLRAVPDISHFKNLAYINFKSNDISELKGGWFRNLTVLWEINLQWNPVDFVRESAFLIDPPPINDFATNLTLSIILDGTYLTSGNFSPLSGIDKIQRPVFLSLSERFDSLPQDVFQGYLEANPKNRVSLVYNKELQCDRRVKWLQERKEEFEKRVGGAECSNDPGKTVWDSEMVNNSGWSIQVQGPGILISLGLALFFRYFTV